jgi:hypothetical protein
LNTLNTLDIYYKTFKTNKNNASENDKTPVTYNNLVEICIKAEETPASLDEYRQKIYYLQLLEPSACSKYLEEGENNNQNVNVNLFLKNSEFYIEKLYYLRFHYCTFLVFCSKILN